MSNFTPFTLPGTISAVTQLSPYGETDGTGMELEYRTYTAQLSVTSKTTGDESTRNPGQFNGIDIYPGAWVSDSTGEKVLKIISISGKSQSIVQCTLEDVDMLCYRTYGNNEFSNGSTITVFNTNEEGEPIILDNSVLVAGAIDKIQGLFALNERDDRVRFSHASPTSVENGDIVTIDNSGNLVKYGDPSGSDMKLGTVLDVIKNGKDVFIKPFNDIIRNYKNPESLNGSVNSIYYTDLNNVGDITTTSGGKRAYLQLNSAIPTTVVASSNLPTGTDIIELNGVTIFDGPSGDTVADLDAFKNLINTFTASTNVVASSSAVPVSVQGGDFAPAFAANDFYSSDSYIATGQVGGAQTYGSITIEDGVNSAVTITFDNPDDTMSVNGTPYDVVSPAAMLTKFQNAITSGGLDLVAELIDMDVYDGQTVKISTTGSATEVRLTNVSQGLFNRDIVGSGSWTGIGTLATVGSPILTLTRNSGGIIDITGTPLTGGWINTNGAVSSLNGRVPYLLLIEDEVGGASEVGIETSSDLNQIPNVTSSDGDATGVFITYTPFSDSNVQILVNGVDVNLGDGVKTKACYFSGDGGTNARAIADITAGDQLYWNGSIIGYELDGGDEVDVIYDASSNDV